MSQFFEELFLGLKILLPFVVGFGFVISVLYLLQDSYFQLVFIGFVCFILIAWVTGRLFKS